MSIAQQFLDEVKRKLVAHSPTLAPECRTAAHALLPVLAEHDGWSR